MWVAHSTVELQKWRREKIQRVSGMNFPFFPGRTECRGRCNHQGRCWKGFWGEGVGPHRRKEHFSKDASEEHWPPLRMLDCLLFFFFF